MRKVSVFAAPAIAGGLLFSAAPALAAVTVGTASPFGANCYPLSCAGRYSISEYQQEYNSAAFPGPISFNQISFNAATGYAGDVMDPAAYNISFYLTPNTALSTNLASNEATLLGSFGTFSLSGTLPSTLSLLGSLINYDPSMGNLLMDVTVGGASTASGTLGYFVGEGNVTAGSVSRVFTDSNSTRADEAGLVTTFAALPEPATWAMMLMGFGAIGIAMRGSRRKTALA